MRRVRVIADFHVGDNLESELLLEIMDAAISDVLYEKDEEWMTSNFGDVVKVEQIFLGGSRWMK